jgi:uncharacterized membrane protein
MGQIIRTERLDRRYGELDFLRAAAIMLMVTYHLAYDLKEFMGLMVDYQAPFWYTIGKTAALLFIFLSGISNGLSNAPVRRGVKVLFCGLGISVVTYLFLKEEYVRFGILHYLGMTMIFSPWLFRLSSRMLLALAACSACLGFWFSGLIVNTAFLLPLGLKYPGFSTIDYFPVFPYLAVTILGMLTYRIYYKERRKPLIRLRAIPKSFQWLSRNSLVIYLVHQPVILLIIVVVSGSKLF